MKPMMRYVGQQLRINNDVVISILSANDETGEISFGIDAPRDIRIHKAERYYVEKVADLNRQHKQEKEQLVDEIVWLEEELERLKELLSIQPLEPKLQTTITVKRKISKGELNTLNVIQRYVEEGKAKKMLSLKNKHALNEASQASAPLVQVQMSRELESVDEEDVCPF